MKRHKGTTEDTVQSKDTLPVDAQNFARKRKEQHLYPKACLETTTTKSMCTKENRQSMFRAKEEASISHE
jgi:hypothetical protein